jgi:uncharacterized repeat protein (TIGR01451 family)
MKLKHYARSLTVAMALAAGAVATVSIATESSSLVAEAQGRYFVFFGEEGALHYQGGEAGLARTAPEREGVPFDSTRGEVVAYRDHLANARAQHIASLEGVLGRSVEVTYHYDILHNGIVVEGVTPAEAALIASQPMVREVSPVRNYELSTDRVEEFIGAGTVWEGDSTPTGTGSKGEGQTIAVIDTGLLSAYQTHPAFTNDASCGFSAALPKVKKAKDCIGSGSCEGTNPHSINNPHGTHVASTAAGNTHVATGGALAGTRVSGVAPCAALVTYKVCPSNSCDGAALNAAFNTILSDQATYGITAVNYSISGGQNPWADADRQFLNMVNQGIFVAASAGNTSTTVPNPIGQVNHRGPWVMTVANSTHDRISSNEVSVAGGPDGIYGLKSDAPFTSDVSGQIANSSGAPYNNPLGCTSSGGFSAGSMTGKIALIDRGDCSFEEKINNAVGAGAIAVIIANNNAGPPILMGLGTATARPSVMIGQSDGAAIRAYIGTNPTAVATIDSETVVSADPVAGDVLSTGSLRGPIGGGIEVTKPDITGPGTNIFAAYDAGATSYGYMSGTSMSGPHVAGAGALIQSVNDDWTPQEVKSAIMMTAFKDGLKDFTNGTPNNGPWDADDVGNGRLDLTKASLAGLVMHETYANFLAAQNNQANQRALNLPSMRNTACTPNCTFTRTVRNALGTATSWTATGVGSPKVNVSVSPSTFSFDGDLEDTQQLTITVTPIGNQTAAVAFGEVVLSEADDASPDLHMTVAIRGQGGAGDPVADLAIDLTATPASIGNGESVSFLADVENLGPDAATGVTVELELPAGATYVDGGVPGNGELSIATGAIATGKGGAAVSGSNWTCTSAGQTVNCTLPGSLASGADAPLTVQATVMLANPETVTATAEVSADQVDNNAANNTDSADVEVTGEPDLIFADGFEDATEPGMACVDLTGAVGNGAAGDPSNTVINLDIGAGNKVTGVAADLTVTANDPSWLAEAVLTYGSTTTGQIDLTPAGEVEEPGTADYSTGGVLVLADLELPDIEVDADGILKLEFNEAFDDTSVNPDANWSNGEPAATCPGLYLQCLDQAACDQAVNDYNSGL